MKPFKKLLIISLVGLVVTTIVFGLCIIDGYKPDKEDYKLFFIHWICSSSLLTLIYLIKSGRKLKI